jgi:uncharacterized protein YheU (UPF0270 family)
MSDYVDVIIERDREVGQEEGIVVPLERIEPDTLHNLVEEFVTREWSELTDAGYSLGVKVEQVLQQLLDGRAKVVFDLVTETCNIATAEAWQGIAKGNENV